MPFEIQIDSASNSKFIRQSISRGKQEKYWIPYRHLSGNAAQIGNALYEAAAEKEPIITVFPEYKVEFMRPKSLLGHFFGITAGVHRSWHYHNELRKKGIAVSIGDIKPPHPRTEFERLLRKTSNRLTLKLRERASKIFNKFKPKGGSRYEYEKTGRLINSLRVESSVSYDPYEKKKRGKWGTQRFMSDRLDISFGVVFSPQLPYARIHELGYRGKMYIRPHLRSKPGTLRKLHAESKQPRALAGGYKSRLGFIVEELKQRRTPNFKYGARRVPTHLVHSDNARTISIQRNRKHEYGIHTKSELGVMSSAETWHGSLKPSAKPPRVPFLTSKKYQKINNPIATLRIPDADTIDIRVSGHFRNVNYRKREYIKRSLEEIANGPDMEEITNAFLGDMRNAILDYHGRKYLHQGSSLSASLGEEGDSDTLADIYAGTGKTTEEIYEESHAVVHELKARILSVDSLNKEEKLALARMVKELAPEQFYALNLEEGNKYHKMWMNSFAKGQKTAADAKAAAERLAASNILPQIPSSGGDPGTRVGEELKQHAQQVREEVKEEQESRFADNAENEVRQKEFARSMLEFLVLTPTSGVTIATYTNDLLQQESRDFTIGVVNQYIEMLQKVYEKQMAKAGNDPGRQDKLTGVFGRKIRDAETMLESL